MGQIKLESVRRAFRRWRARKRRRGEPVPERLWAKAVEAAQVHGSTRTARQLGLNHSVLKRRLERAGPTHAQEFVEVPLGLPGPRESVVEVEDAEGARLRLVLPDAKPEEVAAAARELWSARR